MGAVGMKRHHLVMLALLVLLFCGSALWLLLHGGQQHNSDSRKVPPRTDIQPKAEVPLETRVQPSGKERPRAAQKAGREGPWVQLVSGSRHTCGLDEKGKVACWGKEAPKVEPPDRRFKQISSGGSHMCGILARDSTLMCWGEDFRGSTKAPKGAFTQVSAGWDYTCAIRQKDAGIVCWGWNDDTQGKAPAGEFRAVSAGYHHSCGLKKDGTLTCWGKNHEEQCNVPAGTFEQVVVAKCHTCGLKSDGAISCWGCNPQQLEAQEGGAVVAKSGRNTSPTGRYRQLSAGYLHTCAVSRAGKVECWGHNAVGQSDVLPGKYAIVEAGFFHTCGTTLEGRLKCWGWEEPFTSAPVVKTQDSANPRPPTSKLRHTCPYEGLGLLYLRQGRQDKASGSLGEAMDINKNLQYKKLVQLSRRQISQGNHDKARQLLDKARQILIASPLNIGANAPPPKTNIEVKPTRPMACSWYRSTCRDKDQICDLLTNRCVKRSPRCTSNKECSEAGTSCHMKLKRCRLKCAPDGSCPYSQTCGGSSRLCIPAGKPCSADGTCPAGQKCFAHGCVSPCSGPHTTCPAGEFCALPGRYCRPMPRICSKEGECSHGQRCHLAHRRCYSSCKLGCPDDFMCDKKVSLCRPSAPPCVTDAECGEDTTCREWACIQGCSARSNKCPAGHVCDPFGRICRPTPPGCSSDDDCGRMDRCYLPHKRCYHLCGGGGNCPPSAICDTELQVCRSVNKPCSSGADCPDRSMCSHRGCMALCSEADSTCPEGQTCSFGAGVCE